MEGFWTKMVIVLLGFHSMNHLLHHQRTPHLYRLGVQAAFNFSRLPKECYVQLKDINIGVLSGMTNEQILPNGDAVCIRKPSSRAESEAVAFAVQRINKDDLLPNNIKLGFVVLNMCFSTQINLASTAAFLPQTECPGERNDKTCKRRYDVVAVLSSGTSDLSISTARLLTPAKIPVVSAFSTSDELSNTDRFPYFLRVVPPDRFQFKAIAELIRLFGWTYVSVVYRSNSYGESAFHRLSGYLNAFNICLDTVAILQYGTKEIGSIAKQLVKRHAKVRVVVLIAYGKQARGLISETQRLLPNKTFVWIGTDAWSSSTKNFKLYDSLKDSLLVDQFYGRFSCFRDWFAHLTPDENSSPWFQQKWEDHFNCSFDHRTCNSSGNLSKSYPRNHLEYVADAVLIIANATSRVLRNENCGNLTGSAARNCVTGPKLLRELKATNQNGYTGRLELDSKGDRYGHYSIHQMTLGPSGTKVLDLVYMYTDHGLEKVKNVTWTTGEKPPQSYCSKPCAPHHARIVKDVPCCWKCKRCEDNQYLEDKGRLCQHCPKFTWPNPNTNYSTCYHLKPRTIRNSNVARATVIILALIGLTVSVGVSLYMCSHRANPVIANDRELSFFMLLAITTGYLTIILFYIKPSQNLCRIIFLLFSTSIASIYGALLVRAIDVFRWYVLRKPSSGEHPKPRTHFMFAVFIAVLQAVLCTVLITQYQTWHGLAHPYYERPYVTNTCIMTHVGLACFTSYSCLILVICFILTLHTPERVDTEEKLIFNCVCLILIVWFCFIPAFLLAAEKFHQIMILVLFLFLNFSAVLFVIFLPKVKAVWHGHNKVGAKS